MTRVVWPAHGDDFLLERWDSPHLNKAELARELGVSVEMVHYHAFKLGLETLGEVGADARTRAIEGSTKLLAFLREHHSVEDVMRTTVKIGARRQSPRETQREFRLFQC